jgi:hypothetical protein
MSGVIVTNSAGQTVPSEVVPIPRTSAHTADSATHAVSFSAASVPALGFETFQIRPSKPSSSSRLHRLIHSTEAADELPTMQRPTASTVAIENQQVRLTFDNSTGLVISWTDISTGTTHPFTQSWGYYQSSEDGNYGVSNLVPLTRTRTHTIHANTHLCTHTTQ